jgi:adenylate cyclase
MTRVLRLDPFPPWIYYFYMGRAQYFLGRYAEALEMFKKFNQGAPKHTGGNLFLAATYAQLGDLEAARRYAAALLRLDPKRTVSDRVVNAFVSRAEDVTRMVDGMRKVGIPE